VFRRGDERRSLKVAHDSVFGGHLWERKTIDRIRLSFYWSRMKPDVRDYTMSCTVCQMMSRKRTTDRVPITQVPFQTLDMDCIGPLDPPSAQRHKCCLCTVDSCTRWLTVYMLKNLSSKVVCDAPLDLLVNVGVIRARISQGSSPRKC